jgi:SAM-dependent methyltransferase
MNFQENKQEIQKIINSFSGRIIEIGGPTPGGFVVVNELGFTMPDKITVTNISNQVIINPFGKNPTMHDVDMIADVTALPFKDNEIDMIISSSLPFSLHEALFSESKRVLIPGGLLIVENQNDEDKQRAKKYNYSPLLESSLADKVFSQVYVKIK